jgi:hypothetical protein
MRWRHCWQAHGKKGLSKNIGDVKASCRSCEVEALTKGATLRSAQLMAGSELIVEISLPAWRPCRFAAGSREPITRTISSAHQHHPARLHHQDVPFRWRFRHASSNSHCFHRSNGSSTLDLETIWSNLAIGRGEQSRSGESNSQLAVAGPMHISSCSDRSMSLASGPKTRRRRGRHNEKIQCSLLPHFMTYLLRHRSVYMYVSIHAPLIFLFVKPPFNGLYIPFSEATPLLCRRDDPPR